MNYSAIYFDDTVNGNGIRVSLFCSGCKRRCCPKCHNKKAWDFNYGNKFTEIEEDSILDYLSKPYVTGISILGGEPMDNLDDGILINLVKNIKNKYPNKTIYVWSGYTYEELILDENGKEFLKYIDMLRDGLYIDALKDVTQYLQGSSNQRYINVQESLKLGNTIEFNWKEGEDV